MSTVDVRLNVIPQEITLSELLRIEPQPLDSVIYHTIVCSHRLHIFVHDRDHLVDLREVMVITSIARRPKGLEQGSDTGREFRKGL